MTVTLLLFASYAEKLGLTSLGLEVADGSTVATLLDSVRRMPGADSLPPSPLVAVNRNYARAGTVLQDGDEVALIPPVAGG
jgi:molybdopterin converting factor subunit 1